jgi:hypothetical protein
MMEVIKERRKEGRKVGSKGGRKEERKEPVAVFFMVGLLMMLATRAFHSVFLAHGESTETGGKENAYVKGRQSWSLLSLSMVG